MSLSALEPSLANIPLSSIGKSTSSWKKGYEVELVPVESSSLIDKVFGVFSGVFLLASLVKIADRSSELYHGPTEKLQKSLWDKYGRCKLISDVGREIASAISSSFHIVNALRDFAWIRSKLWSYNTVGAVASCFGAVASGCEIISQVQTIREIDRELKQKISLFKEAALKDHRLQALYDIAMSVTNIALIILFTAYSFVGAPVLLGAALALFVVTSPLLYLAISQKFRNYFSHKEIGACCKVFA